MLPSLYPAAGAALAAGRIDARTVERLGHIKGEPSFAHLPRPRQEVRMSDAAVDEAALKGLERAFMTGGQPHGCDPNSARGSRRGA